MEIIDIARLCHECNRALCEVQGDFSQKDWYEAPQWQRDSAVNGVEFVIAHPDLPPSASHDNWLEVKLRDGWVYGEEKDTDKKTHPCIVAFEDLPKHQQIKDKLFKAVVLSVL